MNLYQRLFGLNCMAPAGDGADLGGGTQVDRGDTFEGSDDDAKVTAPEAKDDEDDDVGLPIEKPATEADKPRDASGKFAKKGDDAPPQDEIRIPKARFDDAVRKERERADAAERRLAEIEAAKWSDAKQVDAQARVEEVRALRRKQHAALLQNDFEEADRLADEADELNRQIAYERATGASSASIAAARESDRVATVLQDTLVAYPMLDENSDEFNQDMVDMVLDTQRGLIDRQRLAPSTALQRAVDSVMKFVQPKPEIDHDAETPVDKAAQRKAAAVAKALEASNAQPPSTRLVGADSDKHGQKSKLPPASQMTPKEFAGLTKEQRAAMRGDFVAA